MKERIANVIPIIILMLSILTSLSTIYLCRHSTNTSDPGRGGALAVALSFIYLFLNRGSSHTVFKLLAGDVSKVRDAFMAPAKDADERITRVNDKLDRLVNTLVNCQTLEDKELRVQNSLLAISSVIGTLAWGFGDKVALHIAGWP